MPTNEQQVIDAAEVRALVESGYSDWRELVRVSVRAYERKFGAAQSYIYPLPNNHASDAEMRDAAEQVWQDFWVPIFERLGLKVPGPDEAISLDELARFIEQVKNELYDAHALMRNVSIIYSEVTHHQVSKPMTDPYVVAQLAHEHAESVEREDIWELFDAIKEEADADNLSTIAISDLRDKIEGHYGVRETT